MLSYGGKVNIFEITKQIKSVVSKQVEIKKLATELKNNPSISASDSIGKFKIHLNLEKYEISGIEFNGEVLLKSDLPLIIEATNNVLIKANGIGAEFAK